MADIKPTRSEYIDTKRKIKLSQNGYKILKMKRDGLIMEFFKILEQARDTRGALMQSYVQAQEMMAIANTIEGSIGVKAAAFSVRENPDITLKSKNIMGVVVPEIASTQVRKGIAERGYGVIGTTPVIADTAQAFEALQAGGAAPDPALLPTVTPRVAVHDPNVGSCCTVGGIMSRIPIRPRALGGTSGTARRATRVALALPLALGVALAIATPAEAIALVTVIAPR